MYVLNEHTYIYIYILYIANPRRLHFRWIIRASLRKSTRPSDITSPTFIWWEHLARKFIHAHTRGWFFLLFRFYFIFLHPCDTEARIFRARWRNSVGGYPELEPLLLFNTNAKGGNAPMSFSCKFSVGNEDFRV